MNIKIDDDIKNILTSYCKINNLKINRFVNESLRKILIIERFGEKPPFINDANKLNVRDRVYGIGNDTIDMPHCPHVNVINSEPNNSSQIDENTPNIKIKNKRSL